MSGKVISADTVLPVSSEPLKNGSVAVLDGKIIDVGPTEKVKEKFSDFERIHQRNSLILPGFINAHIHLELGWIKEKLRYSSSFISWLEQIVSAKSEYITKSTISRSVEKGIAEVISSGVTTVGEISSYGGLDIPLLKQSGLRTVLFKEIVDSKSEQFESMGFEKDGIYEERPFPHAPYSCSPDLLEKVFGLCVKNSLPLGIHIAESMDEVRFVQKKDNGLENIVYPMIGKTPFRRKKGRSPVEYISNYLQGRKPKLTAVHMVQIGSEDIDIISDLDAGVVLCPRSNELIKVGKPDPALFGRINRTGLGTDGLSSNRNLNFFDEIKALNSLLTEKKVKDSFKKSVSIATLGGAKSLFIEEMVGSLEKGKDADIICLDTRGRRSDPYETVVRSESEDLLFSMVRGNFIFKRD